MKKVIILGILLLSFISCEVEEAGTASDGNPVSSILGSFNKNSSTFNNSTIDMSQVSVEVVDSIPGAPAGVLGACELVSRKIYLVKSFWNRASSLEKELILYHEMGHCHLDRGHETRSVQSIPISIMYPEALPGSLYKQYRNAYIEELFTRDSYNVIAGIENDNRSIASADHDHLDEPLLPKGFCGNSHD